MGLGVISALKTPRVPLFPELCLVLSLPSPLPTAAGPLKQHNPEGGEGERPPQPWSIPPTAAHTARLERNPKQIY